MTRPGYMPSSALLGTRRKIIYVDDMNYSLISLKKALSKYYEVYLSESADKMYKIMEKVIPDLILLDVNMPEVDGYSTIKNLKTDERYSNIPVIFLTCNSDKDNVVKGLSLGAVDYVIKPFNTEKLVESIESIFNPKTTEEKKPTVKNDNNPSILVVDDMTSMLRTIHHSLPDKYKVFLLSKSEVVIDFLQNNKPDIILLDYIMPGINGFELIPKIKELPGYEKTPIIMISSEGTFRNVNDAIALGAADFIVKPFDPKELIYKVEKQIRMMKLQRESEENEYLLN